MKLTKIFSFHLLDLHCCKLAVDTACEVACQNSLRRQFDSAVEAVESLESGGCGPPSLDVSCTSDSQKKLYMCIGTKRI